MKKDELRQIFGKAGDLKPPLEEMFGNAYLDYPDDSERIPQELAGLSVHNVTNLVTRATELAPKINCRTNQSFIVTHVGSYMAGGNSPVTHEAWWQVIKHMDNCNNGPCRTVYMIACRDKYLNPEAMSETYGDLIKNWKVE